MPTAIELMDSRKFMALMEELGNIWFPSGEAETAIMAGKQKGHTDEQKAAALQAVLDAAGPQVKTQYAKFDNPPRLAKIHPVTGTEIVEEAKTVYPGKRKGGRPKGSKNKRAKPTRVSGSAPKITKDDLDPDKLPMTPAQAKLMAIEADKLAKIHKPANQILADLIRTTIKPRYDQGVRHFAIPAQYQNRMVTVNQEVWKNVLEQEGIGFTELEWVYDQRNWHGPIPHEGTFPLVIK